MILETRSRTCPGNTGFFLVAKCLPLNLKPWRYVDGGLGPLRQTQQTHWFGVTAASDFNSQFFVGCHPAEFPCCVERWCRGSEGQRIWKGLEEVMSVLWLSHFSEWRGTPELRIQTGLALCSRTIYLWETAAWGPLPWQAAQTWWLLLAAHFCNELTLWSRVPG